MKIIFEKKNNNSGYIEIIINQQARYGIDNINSAVKAFGVVVTEKDGVYTVK